MSRSQGHRKSQSTSALNVLASGRPSSSHLSQSTATPRASKRPVNRLNAVVEDDGAEVSTRSPGIEKDIAALQHAIKNKKAGQPPAARRGSSRPPDVMDEVKAAINDVSYRILEAFMRHELIRKVVQSCAQISAIQLLDLLSLQVHLPLTAVLTRHAQTLSSRAARSETTLSPTDEVANALKPELSSIVQTLQGLCLVDRRAKEELGQGWMLELIIDLLLILRAQTAPEGERPIVYLLLDLLCCVLVDSPSNSRVFESLDGLEGVVRVLKGTGVPKEVRMKCIEFLYFYLLPENTQEAQRTPSSASSSSSSSSVSTQLYPPREAATSDTPTPSPTTPSRRRQSTTPDQRSFQDLDIPFVPQTPQKRPEPSLGYLTPSTRRTSSSFTATPSRSVPPSPRHVHPSPSQRAMPPSPSLKTISHDSSRQSIPSSPSHRSIPPSPSLRSTTNETTRQAIPPSPSRRRLSAIERENEANNFGLGLGLPRSSTAIHLASNPSIKRDVTAIKLSEQIERLPSTVGQSTRASSRATTHSSSGSSTVTPSVHSRGISSSSTYTDLASARSAMGRVPSVKRATRRSEEDKPAQPDVEPRPPKIRHSHTSARLSGLAADLPAQAPNLDTRSSQPAMSKSVASHAPVRTPSPNTSMPPPPVPKPTPRKGFPAGITKGLPSSVSSPNLNSPLGPAKRVPSGRLSDKRSSSKMSEVRSVEEKKEMLGKWVGNVDALVEGVEKVSFWGSKEKQ